MNRVVVIIAALALVYSSAAASESCSSKTSIRENVATPTDGGIREDIPGKFRAKYDMWKAELL